MKIITIDREYGSGGREVGKIISEKTGIPCYDNHLIMEAAENFGLSVGMLKDYDEKNIGSTLYNIAMIASNMKMDGENNKTYEIYYAISETVKRLAIQGPAVFIGRCANEALNENRNVVNAFIYTSDIEKRKQRIIEVDGVSGSNAEYALKKRDKQRKLFYEFYTGKKWGERQNYDIMLNTATLGYEACADALIHMAE